MLPFHVFIEAIFRSPAHSPVPVSSSAPSVTSVLRKAHPLTRTAPPTSLPADSTHSHPERSDGSVFSCSGFVSASGHRSVFAHPPLHASKQNTQRTFLRFPAPTSVSAAESALTKFASVTPLESALAKTLDLKSFRIRTYKKRGGRGSKILTTTRPAGSSSIPCVIAAALLWPALVFAQSPNATQAATVAGPAEAIALEQQGKLDEAVKVWQAVIERNTRNAAALASLGVDYSKQRKYAEAASTYRKALALDPQLPGIQLNLGLAEFKQGHFQAAIAPLNAALAAQPDSMQANALLGLSYYGTKRFAEASKHLELAAKADPGNVQLGQVLAQSCLWAKRFDCALEEFRQIEQHDPNSSAVHVLAGEALDGLGRTP